MEYIPDLHKIDLSTFSDHHVATLRTILKSIHEVGIYHGDPYPRNTMVQEFSERVLWIEFDHAQTFSGTEWKWQWMQDEKEMVDEFLDALVSCSLIWFAILTFTQTEDYNDGKISRTWPYYYTYV